MKQKQMVNIVEVLETAGKARKREQARIRQQERPKGDILEWRTAQQATELINAWLSEVQDQHHEARRKFLRHVICSCHKALSDEGWVPVSYKLIRRLPGHPSAKALHEPLVQKGILEVRPGAEASRRSNMYRLSPSYRVDLSDHVGEWNGTDSIRAERKRPDRLDSRMDRNGHSCPTLIKNAIESIGPNLIDIDGIRAWVQHQIDNKEYLSRRDLERLCYDLNCIRSIHRQKPTRVDSGFYSYRPAYTISSTGRVFERAHGIQSITRPAKHAAYSRPISAGLVQNYDLSRAHFCIASEYASKHGLMCPTISRFADPNTDYRRTVSDNTGLPLDSCKKILLSVQYGKGVYPHFSNLSEETKEVLLAATVDRMEAKEVWSKLYPILENLKHDSKTLCRFLKSQIKRAGKSSRYGKSMKNDAGMSICVTPQTTRGELLAHFFQGTETRFIHELTLLSRDFNYRVLANEHDGLITEGLIPQSAIDHAIEVTGYSTLDLRIKPFCSEQEARRVDDVIEAALKPLLMTG